MSGDEGMLSVALTGNVAAGKSSVAELWRDEGVPVVSSDELAREVVRPGTEGLAEVVAAFGEQVLDETGALDRAALRARVFSDEDARRRLESILHPRIWVRRNEWTRKQREEGRRLVVAEVPLLFEAGLEDRFDATVLVDAPEALRLERLNRDRDLDEDEARSIMDAQLDSRIKRARADYVLENAGSLEALREASLELLAVLRKRAGEA